MDGGGDGWSAAWSHPDPAHKHLERHSSSPSLDTQSQALSPGGLSLPHLSSSLSCLLPWYRTAGSEGQKRSNSLIQLGSVESGPMTRNGPLMPLALRWERNPMVWTWGRREDRRA